MINKICSIQHNVHTHINMDYIRLAPNCPWSWLIQRNEQVVYTCINKSYLYYQLLTRKVNKNPILLKRTKIPKRFWKYTLSQREWSIFEENYPSFVKTLIKRGEKGIHMHMLKIALKCQTVKSTMIYMLCNLLRSLFQQQSNPSCGLRFPQIDSC